RMEIAVGDGDVVGDDHPAPHDDALCAHEDGADQDGVVADDDLAFRLDAERGPRVDADVGAEPQAWLARAAEAAEAFFALDEASGSALPVRGEQGVVPGAGDFPDVHGPYPTPIRSRRLPSTVSDAKCASANSRAARACLAYSVSIRSTPTAAPSRSRNATTPSPHANRRENPVS